MALHEQGDLEGAEAAYRAVLARDYRSAEVLPLLARGFSNDAIAAQLVLSRATVKHHVSQILHKLNASSRTEALMLAWRHQLVA